jgi:hypothetical protein
MKIKKSRINEEQKKNVNDEHTQREKKIGLISREK